jgi:hypothetical protein
LQLVKLLALLLYTLTLHLDDEEEGLLLRLPECPWAAMGLMGRKRRNY